MCFSPILKATRFSKEEKSPHLVTPYTHKTSYAEVVKSLASPLVNKPLVTQQTTPKKSSP
jgi:hypothetical protein